MLYSRIFCMGNGHEELCNVLAFTTDVTVVITSDKPKFKYTTPPNIGTLLHESICATIIPIVMSHIDIHCNWFKGLPYNPHCTTAVNNGDRDFTIEIEPGSAIVESVNVRSLFIAYTRPRKE